VPKFLQPYAHLLGQKRQDEDEPQIVAAQQRLQEQDDDEGDDKAAEQVWLCVEAQALRGCVCAPPALLSSTSQPPGCYSSACTHYGLCVCLCNQQQEAIQRALEENPELAAQLDANYLNKVPVPCTPVLTALLAQHCMQTALLAQLCERCVHVCDMELNPVQTGQDAFPVACGPLLFTVLQIEAGKEKELGNKAFAAKDYDTAIQHFSKCIQLDPK
jgi:tetratricopeptide (TPR) repeat protein